MKSGVTLLDICKRAKVSTATASRVINGSPLVVEATKRRVQEAIRELGYHPNFAARMLVRDRTDIIAVIVPPMAVVYFREVLIAVDQVAAAHRHHVVVAMSHDSKDEEELIGRYVQERRADGLVVTALSGSYEQAVREAGAQGCPVVVIGSPIKGKNVSSVTVDNRHGMAQVMQHLAEQGCRTVGLIQGPADNYDSQDRHAGSMAAVARHGLRVLKEWTGFANFESHRAHAWVRARLKEERSRPDALVAFNDDMAEGARTALIEMGLRIPDDIALVGFDNKVTAEQFGLTTVDNPVADMGRVAAELLLARLADGPAAAFRGKVLPTRLIIRESTMKKARASARA